MAPSIEYLNFDLLITRSGGQYRAFVIEPPAGEGNTTFDLPFAADGIERLTQSTGTRRNVRTG